MAISDQSDPWEEIRRLRKRVERLESGSMLENSSITRGRFRVIGGEFRVDQDGVFTLVGRFDQSGDYNVKDGGVVAVEQGGNITVQGGGDVVVAGGGNVTVQGGGEVTVNGPVPVRLHQINVGGVNQAAVQFGSSTTAIYANSAGGNVNLVVQAGSGILQLNDNGIFPINLPVEAVTDYLGKGTNGRLAWAEGGAGGGPGGGGDTPSPGEDLGHFQWPFDLSTVTSEYGPRTTPYTGFHEGIDFGISPAVAGAPIIAAGDGTIAVNTFSSGWGNYVRITHSVGGQSLSTLYAHMNAPGLPPVGSSVSKGDVIGYVGNTGNSYGAHLHFETWTGTSYGSHINPRDFMAAYGPA